MAGLLARTETSREAPLDMSSRQARRL